MPPDLQKFVLCIEDEEVILQIFQNVFDGQEYVLLDTARTVKEALDKLNVCVYDFILLDMQLDGMRHAGMEILRALARLKIKMREEGQKAMDSRITIMSGSVSMDAIMEECNALGVLSFIDKPVAFTSAYLLGILQQLGLPILPRKTAEP